MDIESQPSRKRAADVQTEDLEDNEQMDANESAVLLPQAEGRLLMEECSPAIGNTTILKRTTSIWKTKLPEMNAWASTKVWSSRQ